MCIKSLHSSRSTTTISMQDFRQPVGSICCELVCYIQCTWTLTSNLLLVSYKSKLDRNDVCVPILTWSNHPNCIRRLQWAIVVHCNTLSVISRWLSTFSNFRKRLHSLWKNLTGKNEVLGVPNQLRLFLQIRQQRKPPWPVIGWRDLDLASATTTLISRKLDGKLLLDYLYQSFVFRADPSTTMATLATSNWPISTSLHWFQCSSTGI